MMNATQTIKAETQLHIFGIETTEGVQINWLAGTQTMSGLS
jgi:hypothetical protein